MASKNGGAVTVGLSGAHSEFCSPVQPVAKPTMLLIQISVRTKAKVDFVAGILSSLDHRLSFGWNWSKLSPVQV